MKFLIDNQLPPKLAQWITAQGYDSAHLQDIGLAAAPDIEILEFAAANRYVLVSKDEDFLHLSLTRRGRPQIVWVRLGNCRTINLLSIFGRSMPSLVASLESGQDLVELR